jgi:hypothetical protein
VWLVGKAVGTDHRLRGRAMMGRKGGIRADCSSNGLNCLIDADNAIIVDVGRFRQHLRSTEFETINLFFEPMKGIVADFAARAHCEQRSPGSADRT